MKNEKLIPHVKAIICPECNKEKKIIVVDGHCDVYGEICGDCRQIHIKKEKRMKQPVAYANGRTVVESYDISEVELPAFENPMAAVFCYEHAQFYFSKSSAILVLCINPDTKETLWVKNCAEADYFYNPENTRNNI